MFRLVERYKTIYSYYSNCSGLIELNSVMVYRSPKGSKGLGPCDIGTPWHAWSGWKRSWVLSFEFLEKWVKVLHLPGEEYEPVTWKSLLIGGRRGARASNRDSEISLNYSRNLVRDNYKFSLLKQKNQHNWYNQNEV